MPYCNVVILSEIFKTTIFIRFINKQINTITKVISIYSLYHIVNNIFFIKMKKVFLNIFKYLTIITLLLNYITAKIIFKKFKNHEYYWNMISKCIIENYNSFIIFLFWIILNINEDNNPMLLLFLNKNNDKRLLN